jgi:hypothetical protein
MGQKRNAETPQYAQGFTKYVSLNYTQRGSLDKSAMQQGSHHHLTPDPTLSNKTKILFQGIRLYSTYEGWRQT